MSMYPDRLYFAVPCKPFWHYLLKKLAGVAAYLLLVVVTFVPLLLFVEVYLKWPSFSALGIYLLLWTFFEAFRSWRRQE